MISELHNEDCLVTMPRLEDSSIDLIFADYPFGSKNDPIGYQEFVYKTANEFYRILKDGGNLVIVNNPFNHFRTIRFFDRFFLRNEVALLRRSGFYIAWHFGLAHNAAYFLVKTNNMKAKWNAGNKPNVKFDKDFLEYQNGYRAKGAWHPQAMPLDLVKLWVSYLSNEGDNVYDPFTGSGTTMLACMGTRNFIGSEIDTKYYDMALRRKETA